MSKLKTHYFNKTRFQILDFDSDLFGFKVSKILNAKLTLKELKPLLEKLKSLDIRLVYWQADGACKTSKTAASKLNGFLASEQVTFLTDLKKLDPTPKKSREIKTYKKKIPTKEMKDLAVQIGAISRFGVDPKIPKKLFKKLYHTWIKNSANNTVADKVYITENNNKVTGLITLTKKNKRGDIGLLAVDKNSQGKNLGTKLVKAAQKYFLDKGFSKAQVVTQKANIPACRLYEKCGFHVEKIDNFYHFWL